MKLLASAAVVACCAVLAAVAAPALSLSQWQPGPKDFEATGSRSDPTPAPVRAPGRFNLVGLRWRGGSEPRLRVRTRRKGDRWSRWTPVSTHSDHGPDPGSGEPLHATSAPVWVGEADELQYRLSRPVPGLKLHFVNVEGTATPADRAKTAVRRVADAGVAAVAAPFRAGVAEAQAQQPRIVPRSGWGGQHCQPRSAPAYGEVNAALVHHTVSINSYSRSEAPGVVLGICRFHRNGNGWSDLGYNFLVDKYGTLYEGRAGGIGRAVVGAQAQGYNSQTTGIANIGTHTSVRQTNAALQSIAALIRWKLPLHGAPTQGRTSLVSGGGSSNRYPSGRRVSLERVSGHRDTGLTECPGDALYGQLPALRAMVGGAGSLLRLRLPRRAVAYKRRAKVSGRLGSFNGAPYSGAEVRIQVRRRRRWRTVKQVTTDSDGRFLTRVVAQQNRRMRARFAGSGSRPRASSSRKLLKVRPRIDTRAFDAGRRGEKLRIAGRVRPRKRRLETVVQRERDEGWRRLAVIPFEVKRRSGRFRTFFTPMGRGTYRFYVRFRGDKRHSRGRSKPRLAEIR